MKTHPFPPALLALVAISSLGTGCVTTAPTKVSDWQGFDLRAVRLVAQGQVIALPASPPLTLKIEPDGKVSGQSGVNRYFGAFSHISDGSILWQGSLGATRMAGPPETMKLETEFLKTLTATTELKPGKDVLTFQSASGKNVIEFAKP